ncbi:MAG: LamB/YcsF family protein [Desulfobulbus sp.]|nr:LamB/YcsF family protein [Desulfobulbus sp.]
MHIDINCDLGEGYGAYRMGEDREIIGVISSANIACGFHAGDPQVMARTVRLARDHGVAVGAHPGFPDLLGFGRRNLACSFEEIEAYLTYQIGALQAFCTALQCRLHHVKPHGALYNMAVGNEELVRSMAKTIARIDDSLILVLLAGSDNTRMAALAAEEGVTAVFEAFPDRAYTAGGTLVSRQHPAAVIHDPEQVAARAVRMVTHGVVQTIDGPEIGLHAQTLCVHGDHPHSVQIANSIRHHLEAAGVTIRSM